MTELTRIRKYMQKLREDRDQEIQTVKQSLRDAEAGIRDAETRKDQASRVTDLSAYQEAEKDLEAARTKRSMYSERLHQLQDLDFVTDQESEETIKSILAYEQTIGTQIDERIREHVESLDHLLQGYENEIQDAEGTIKDWTSTIHPNFISEGTIYAETGTHYSKDPVPVRRTPYEGTEKAKAARRFIRVIRELHR